MEYITEDEVQRLLAPHHATLARCARRAFEIWQTKVAPLFPEPLRRARAAIISNAFHNLAKAAMADVPGVRLVEENERLLIVFTGKFVLRFKLVDEELRTRNYPTETSNQMDGQVQLEMAGWGSLPRVVFGYMLAGTPERLEGLYVIYAIDRKPFWWYDPEDAAPAAVLFPPKAPPPPPSREAWEKRKDLDVEDKAGEAGGDDDNN